MADEVYGLSGESIERMRRIARIVEGDTRKQQQRRSKYPVAVDGGGGGTKLGRALAAIAKGAIGDVTLLTGSQGSEVPYDPPRVLEDVYNRFGDVEEDSDVHVVKINGKWEISQAECREDE